jgi:hypothetical protein
MVTAKEKARANGKMIQDGCKLNESAKEQGLKRENALTTKRTALALLPLHASPLVNHIRPIVNVSWRPLME